MKLKITGLKTNRGDDPPPLQYPKSGTKSAQVIECLEAESATVDEISRYLKVDSVRARGIIQKLRGAGIVKHNGDSHYQLVDPEGASLAYSDSSENECEK